MKFKTPLIALGIMLVLCFALTYSCNQVCKQSEEKTESRRDSLDQYLGKSVVIDSQTHVLVNANVWKNEYITDKGTVLDYQFVVDYFNDTTTVDTPSTKVDTNLKGNE